MGHERGGRTDHLALIWGGGACLLSPNSQSLFVCSILLGYTDKAEKLRKAVSERHRELYFGL